MRKSFRYLYQSLIIFSSVLLIQGQACQQSGFELPSSSSKRGISSVEGSGAPIVELGAVMNNLAVSNQNKGSFTFTVTAGTVTAIVKSIECQIKVIAWPFGVQPSSTDPVPEFKACQSPYAYTFPSGGVYQFSVRATDDKGNMSRPVSTQIIVDMNKPVVEMVSAPAKISGVNTASFSFTSVDDLSGVLAHECALDQAGYASCQSPINLAALTAGAHTFKIRAKDKAGNVSDELLHSWSVDIGAPTVTLAQTPAMITNSVAAQFTFTGTANSVALTKFECQLDAGAFATCTSPFNYTNLSEGPHTFTLRGSTAQNVVSSPVSYKWSIDKTPPTIQITKAPAAFSKVNSASLEFIGADQGGLTSGMVSSFECQLDAGAYAACTSPKSFPGLTEGARKLNVRAKDMAGNISAVATADVIVDLTLPVLTLSSTPALSTAETSASFVFNATDANGIAAYECSLDTAAYTACVSSKTYAGLGSGTHNFKLRAIDKAGNISLEKNHAWTITGNALDGAALYATNCAGCHGALAMSNKKDTTAAKISAGITSVPSMNSLKTLSTAQIQAIADALKGAPVIIGSGEDLYKTNCSGCHGGIIGSSVPRFDVTTILNAIATKPSMAKLKGVINQQQAELISEALQKNNVGDTTAVLFPPLKPMCAGNTTRGVANKNFKRFIKLELVNTLNDLLGTAIVADTKITGLLSRVKEDEIQRSVTDLAEVQSFDYLSSMIDIGMRAAELMMSTAANRTKFLGTCGNDATLTDACVRSMIQNFGLQAYRRPLSTTQIDGMMTYYKSIVAKFTTNATLLGAQAVFSRLLSSPYMYYHVEAGATVEGNRIRLTNYEVASRISYRIAATMPDALLLQAAANGELATLAGVKKHANRLMSSAKAKEKSKLFFRNYAKLENVATPNKFVATMAGIDINNFAEEAKQEALDYMDNVVWNRSGSFYDLMTSSEIFPRSARMAKILETNIANGNVPVTGSKEHSGLFLRPALLASDSDRTDIIHRGIEFRRNFLCSLGNGTPPTDLTSAAKGIDFALLTNRDGISQMTGSIACLRCHMVFNPVGYLLEGHNQLGMTRTVEPIFDVNGKFVKSFPINTKVTRAYIDRNNDTALDSASQMLEKFGTSDDAKMCFSLKAFSFYNQKSYSLSNDGCAIEDVKDQIRSGSVLSAIEASVANEDIFWKGK